MHTCSRLAIVEYGRRAVPTNRAGDDTQWGREFRSDRGPDPTTNAYRKLINELG